MSGPLHITRMGAHGDGVADTELGPVFVPFTLPGETVTAAVAGERADLIAVLDASPERVTPPCRHFGVCGGCALQHWQDSAYRAWKRTRLSEALSRAGIAGDVEASVPCLPGSRRRVVLSARRTEGGVLLGYRKALSHSIVDIAECPIAEPAIVAALPRLRALAGLIAATGEAFHVTVTRTASGLDVAASDSGQLDPRQRLAAADFVIADSGVARLTVGGEAIVAPRMPQVAFGPVMVTPPPGGFLQAVLTAEEAMADLVTAHLAPAGQVADLFAGTGTFALRLAAGSAVHAVEGDAAALAALDRAFRAAIGLRRVTTERRDLIRRPVTAKELAAFDGLVFDPPRAGAQAQAAEIARSAVPRVAAVSCNPTTLARDLRILIDGGYRLLSAVPIDQFLWSPHVEAVALLEKKPVRRGGRR